MASEDEPIYCLCHLPYDETRFMIECDVCKDWFHGNCVGIKEHQAADIEIYHCPVCTPKHGPLSLKSRQNWHRHDYSEDGSKVRKAVQTGTVVFIKDLKSKTFPSADEIPIKRLHGSQLTLEYFDREGFDVPILCEKKDGLGLTLPPASMTIQDIEQLVGPMREIDVIDVPRQEDIKMIMREWTEYYNSPNRDKILNVISLEFSNSRLSELVVPPSIIRQVSWARNVWPEELPEGSNLARPEVQKYCLMGVKDSFTDFHIDFGGTSVWYHVLRGEKVFYLIPPSQTNMVLYERWLSSFNQSEMFFGNKVSNCYRMIVKQGHTLFIPTGWIHAVLTPIDSLVFGGNFLHSYNIPLQLQCYEIERLVKTPEKYLFPSYETMNWYAAKQILDMVKEDTEENKMPPEHLINGLRALGASLKTWTQRKDLTSKFVYAQVTKRDAADYIQYGKLLKDLMKEVKKMNGMQKTFKSPKKKGAKTVKAVKGLDTLEQHTKDTLKSAERERRESIYNFDDEEDTPFSLKVRIPKAGAYVAEHEILETKPDIKPSSPIKKGVTTDENKVSGKRKLKEEPTDSLGKDLSPTRMKKGVKKKGVTSQDTSWPEDKVVMGQSSPVKEVPQCLKFKLSNGKMVSTDRKPKSAKLKKEILKKRAVETAGLSSSERKNDADLKKSPKNKDKESKPESADKKSSSRSQSEKEKKKKLEVEKKRRKYDEKEDKKKVKTKREDEKKDKSEKEDKKKEKPPRDGKKEKTARNRDKSDQDDKRKERPGKEDKKKDNPGKEVRKKDNPGKEDRKKEKPQKEDKNKEDRNKDALKKDEECKKPDKSDVRKDKKKREASKTCDSSKGRRHLEDDKKISADKKLSETETAIKSEPPHAKHTTDLFAFKDSDDDGDKDSDREQLVVDDNPRPAKVQKTTSTTKPASLKLKLPSGAAVKVKVPGESKPGEDNAEAVSSRLDLETIRGGLNGSISDILTASGYGTETAFKVDNDSSGMRDAIAGMLTMSRLGEGDTGGPLFSSDDQDSQSQAEEEEQLMADCYADGEFVYPSFELSDNDEAASFKAKKKSDKDDNWNPKARVNTSLVKDDREQRVGVQKQSMATNLASTAAKLAENPPNECKHKKKGPKAKLPDKKEFEVEPLPGPSSALDSDGPVNAFRPGIKRPLDPCANMAALQTKAKKPKKGQKTAKQRLGKLLKIRKMVF